MPNPKRRHSKSRRDKRRTHDRIKKKGLSACSQCGRGRLSHRICPFCGYYKGAAVVEIKAKSKKQKR